MYGLLFLAVSAVRVIALANPQVDIDIDVDNASDIVDASDVEAFVPTGILPPSQATDLANGIDSFIASVTADPRFSSVASVLATAVPPYLLANPNPSAAEAYLLSILTATSLPSWITALPPSVTSYVIELGQGAEGLLKSDAPALYTQVTAIATVLGGPGGYAGPAGGYGGGGANGTAGSGETAVASAGSGAAPAGPSATAGPGGSNGGSPPPEDFTGGAASARGVALVGVLAGVVVGGLLLL
ncbi:MAG: hypothetical protein LQ342_000564 [Letrouitia transgressa]|nr:MAG: hypothetical protein LQ342_000564 [Letrouitia transgressa]